MKNFLLPLFALGFSVSALAQSQEIPYASTIAVEAGDTPEEIIAKAAHVVPTANQLAALKKEFIAFVHFGPNTFTRMEWGSGKEDPSIFALQTLDTDQWCEAMKAAGMKMVLFTVKHHDGFVLWQSRYTKHGIMSTSFQNGRGDILRDLSASCRKYGLRLGIYLSPADLYQIENAAGLYGNLSKATLRTIPREVEGRPFENKTKFEFVVDDYNEYFLNQLFELLTEYGPVDEVWFDGAHPKRKGGQTYNYPAWRKLIHTLAPNAVIFGREDVRWCGNEGGHTRQTEWNVIPYAANPDTMSVFHDLTDTDLGSREKLLQGRYLHYQQAETNTSIREGWFYRDDSTQNVRSADDVFDIYERSVGGNSTFLLNIPPNREGRFSDIDAGVLREVGGRIAETYGKSLLEGAEGPQNVLDGNESTYVSVTEPVEISLRSPITINRIMLQEAVAQCGERVESHAVDAFVNGDWKEIACGTNIGYKRILRFPSVTTDRIRIRVTSSRLTPAISLVSAHYYAARPPQLFAKCAADGMLTISAKRQNFGWNSDGSNASETLGEGFAIHYTTDGTQPTEASPLYTAPFKMQSGVLKAVSILNGKCGPVMSERIGFAKNEWSVRIVGDEDESAENVSEINDAEVATFWQNKGGDLPVIEIDLGMRRTLSGFAYTPPVSTKEGLMAKGSVLVSKNGKKWIDAGSFYFGNLVNDPTRREFLLSQKMDARYVRIVPSSTADGGNEVTISEIDVF